MCVGSKPEVVSLDSTCDDEAQRIRGIIIYIMDRTGYRRIHELIIGYLVWLGIAKTGEC